MELNNPFSYSDKLPCATLMLLRHQQTGNASPSRGLYSVHDGTKWKHMTKCNRNASNDLLKMSSASEFKRITSTFTRCWSANLSLKSCKLVH